MTHRERFIKTLKCEKIGGRVPHFELVFFLTMEAFGRVHPSHRSYTQWDQMSLSEKTLHINDMADIYIKTAERYEHSAIFIHPNPGGIDNTLWLLEAIRERTGDQYFIMMHGDPTFSIPDGDRMMEFAVAMLEQPEKLKQTAKQRVEGSAEFARELNKHGRMLDGFALCSDYCFNINPFFTPDQFAEFIAPYLKNIIDIYREMGFYTIKHTDGNIMPILKQIVDCRPDALHSLDPQGGVDMKKVREIAGENIALIGNVNCGLLQTGTDEQCDADVMRSLNEGMQAGGGYIFSTSNCVYTGLALERYERMWRIWKEHGCYDDGR